MENKLINRMSWLLNTKIKGVGRDGKENSKFSVALLQ